MPVDNRQYHDYDGQHDDFAHLRIVILSAAKDLFASQAKPLQNCHPERSEGSLAGHRSFAALRMTSQLASLFFDMY
jgi:hypothetical protein